jgi:hypothetical protein
LVYKKDKQMQCVYITLASLKKILPVGKQRKTCFNDSSFSG